MTFREHYGEDAVRQIFDRIEALLDAEAGFIIIGNLTNKTFSDAYMNVCDKEVLNGVKFVIKCAVEHGLLEQHTKG